MCIYSNNDLLFCFFEPHNNELYDYESMVLYNMVTTPSNA